MKILMAVMVVLGLVGCNKKEDSCCCKPTTAVTERRKDVVCGMWVEKTDKAIKAEFDGADYYFCAEDCKKAFLKDTRKYVALTCGCKKYRPNCKCDHCAGKREPCDCIND